MIKTVIYSVISLVIFSCNADKCKNINCLRPFTQKENKFLDSLEKKGYTYEVWRFNYPFSGDSIDCCIQEIVDEYSLYIKNYEYEKVKNIDSIRQTAKKIAVEIYSKILSDSMINYTSGIFININGKSQKEQKTLITNYSTHFKKEDLASYCGFIVLENEKGNLENIKFVKKNPNLIFYNELFYPIEKATKKIK